MKYLIQIFAILTIAAGVWFVTKALTIKPVCPVHTQYDVILECQKLSATTSKTDWGYKDCVTELGKTLNTKFIQL
jgi:hypothetical protein